MDIQQCSMPPNTSPYEVRKELNIILAEQPSSFHVKEIRVSGADEDLNTILKFIASLKRIDIESLELSINYYKHKYE